MGLRKSEKLTVKGRILVSKGKHGDRYWMAETKEQLLAAFLAMFEMHDENGYYYTAVDQDLVKEIDSLKATLAELRANPKLAHLAPDVAKRLEGLRSELPDEELVALYPKAKAGDGEAARDIIAKRSDWEYENYELLTVEDPLS